MKAELTIAFARLTGWWDLIPHIFHAGLAVLAS
jgi:hypothetical protein